MPSLRQRFQEVLISGRNEVVFNLPEDINSRHANSILVNAFSSFINIPFARV
jgi:hypothetical protein